MQNAQILHKKGQWNDLFYLGFVLWIDFPNLSLNIEKVLKIAEMNASFFVKKTGKGSSIGVIDTA